MIRLYTGHTLLLCMLFISMTFYQNVYPPLYAAALLSAVLVARSMPLLMCWKTWLPVGFMLWVALVSGKTFTDLPLASLMLAAYLCGLGIAARPLAPGVPPEAKATTLIAAPMLLLLGLIGVHFLYALCTQNPDFYWNGRLALFFDHPNVLGHIAGWGALYCMVRWRSASRAALPLWVGLGALACAAVVLAGARGVYLGFGLAVLVILLTLYRSHALKILPAVALVAALAISFLPAAQQERIFSALRSPVTDTTVRMRMPIWLAALDGFCAAPITGQGLRSFADHHQQYVAENLDALKAITPVVEERVANPHNLYVGLLYAYGLGGIALLLLAFGPTTCHALRACFNSSFQPDAVFYLATLCFLLGTGTADYGLHRKDAILILFLTQGALAFGAPSGADLINRAFKWRQRLGL